MAALPMSSALTVFGLPAQAETARVLTCLFEKELNFELVRRDSYRASDGYRVSESVKELAGQVTLKEGGQTIVSGSRDICRHLCNQYPASGQRLMLGAGELERAEIEKWIHKESNFFDSPSSDLVLQIAFNPPACKLIDEMVVQRSEQNLREVFDEYDQQLKDNEYLAGDEFSLADLFHLPNTEYLFRTRQGYSLITERIHVKRWWDLISERESWRKVKEMQKEHPGAFEAA